MDGHRSQASWRESGGASAELENPTLSLSGCQGAASPWSGTVLNNRRPGPGSSVWSGRMEGRHASCSWWGGGCGGGRGGRRWRRGASHGRWDSPQAEHAVLFVVKNSFVTLKQFFSAAFHNISERSHL
ncbi:hypothetical protein HJG60_011779 [Phyllostomus discolor]|uniref:Uncharacterized protein n=1 Tax=Phyllostomus discolor TaxID=89673 RepID=A0A834DWC6_9CHIR|nr:hypothetical protein HJG60_011779 [Phyllostomus discolor]